MSDTPDTPKKPNKRKGNSIKLGLFLPWDEDGRLFNPDKYRKPDDEPAETPSSKIIPLPRTKDNDPPPDTE